MAAAIHPHLIRAFKLSRVFTIGRGLGDAALAALDQSAHALFILDRTGRLDHMNRAGRRIVDQRRGLAIVGGRLVGAAANASRMLEGLILTAGSPDPAIRRGGSMATPTTDGDLPLSITVAPLQPADWLIFGDGPSVLVSVIELASVIEVSEAQMRDLFALSDAEARVTRLLLRGAKPRQIADATGVGIATVRTQLASAFAKTGAGDQSELCRLMARLAAGGRG